MSGSRPLPPRALPPIQPVSETQEIRTPRKKKMSTGPHDTSVASSGKRRPPRRSPRGQAKQDGSPHAARSLPATGGEDDSQNGPISAAKPRTKRRKRPTSVQADGGQGELANGNPISSLIKEEDVVDVDQVEEAVVLTNLPGVAAGAGGSAATDKVYIQTTNGFVSHSQDWLKRHSRPAGDAERLTYGDDIIKASHIAEQNERGFMYLTLVAHGLLCGLSVWQVVVAYAVFNRGESDFIIQFQSLAPQTQTAYYIILVFCVISSMDRFDLGAKDKSFFRGIARFDLAAVSSVVYFTALLFSIGMAGLDAWLGSGIAIPRTVTTATPVVEGTTPEPLPPELTGENVNASSTVNTWLILNVIRAVLSCLGWLLIAVEPQRNDMEFETR